MAGPALRVERIVRADPRFESAKKYEFEIFGAANQFLSAADEAAGEMVAYRPYDAHSEFHVAWAEDDPGTPVGLIRFLRHDPARGLDSFSTLHDGRSYAAPGRPAACYLADEWLRFFDGVDPATVAELATEAVVPAYRGKGVVLQLWKSFATISDVEGVDVWTMALVVPMFRFYQAMFPNAVQAIGEIMPDYIGADSVPATILLRHPEAVEFRRRHDI